MCTRIMFKTRYVKYGFRLWMFTQTVGKSENVLNDHSKKMMMNIEEYYDIILKICKNN